MLMITGYMVAKPAEAPELLADLRALIPATRAEDGCILYDFAIADERAGTILAVERWRDQAALDAHLAGPNIAQLLGKWGGRIELDVRKHDVSNERGFAD